LILLFLFFAYGTDWTAHAAQIISFNFAGTSTNGNLQPGPSLPGDQAGAPGVRTTNWNNINVISATTATPLGAGQVMDNRGNFIPGMTATLFPFTFDPGTGASATVSNENKLYGYVLDTQNSGSTENALQLTGVPYASYVIFCYRLSNEGSAADPRGGYYSIRDVATNFTFITNLDASVTTNITLVTNWNSTVWASSTNFANPTASGTGYVRSFTTTQPTNMSQINPGNYMVLPGDPNPIVSYTTNIDLKTSTTNVTATTNRTASIYFTPVGGGLRGVAGGDTTQRFKAAGLQIVSLPSANLTNIVLAAPIPNLLAGNTVLTTITPIGQYDDGDTFPLSLLTNTVYTSQNTNVFTVDAFGNILPAHSGTTNLIITSGSISFTNPVTVLPATAARITLAATNLFVGNNNGDSAQAELFADFAGASTNAALSNINVTAFNYVNFTAEPTNLVSVTPGGMVTAVGTGGNNLFSLHATFDTVSASLNAGGQVQIFPVPGAIDSFGINISDGSPADGANFKDLTGAPGVRQAYWNNLNFTVPVITAPANAVVNPVDCHGITLTGTVAVASGVSIGYSGSIVTSTLTSNEYVILHTAYDDGANGNVATTTVESSIIVTNVPYSVYDAYFYFWNDAGNPARVGHVTAVETGETRWRANMTAAAFTGSPDGIAPDPGSTNGAGYDEAIPTIAGSIPNGVLYSNVTLVPGGNYVHFTGLSNSTAVFRWGPDGTSTVPNADGTERLRLAAFQITRNITPLTPTHVYLDGTSSNLISAILPGNPAAFQLSAFADFTDGTKQVNISTLAAYSSSNTNIFNVDTNGVVTAGTTSGAANLIVSYKGLSYTQAVTGLAPISVNVKAAPDTAYIDGQDLPGKLRMFATFPGQTNVEITGFTSNTVLFYNASTNSAAVAAVSGPPWGIYPQTAGTADLAGSYLGVGYTNRAGFTVTHQLDTNSQIINVITNASSLTNNAHLKHRYSFRDAPGASTVLDSVGGANGTIVPGLPGSFPLVLDGERVNFPGGNVYQTTPYIALPSGIVSERADVTIDLWCGMNAANDGARFFDAGTSTKGADEHNDGNAVTWLEFAGKPAGATDPFFQYQFIANNTLTDAGINPFPPGTEQHVTLVYSYNQSVTKLYINGVLQSTGPSQLPLSSLNDSNVWLGVSEFSPDPVLNGWIDELRIYEGAFTDSDATNSDFYGANYALSPIIAATVSGNTLKLSWPAANIGWTLQTNAVSLTTTNAWSAYPGSAATNMESIPISPSQSRLFFRLVSP
jgi:hypothetical protein